MAGSKPPFERWDYLKQLLAVWTDYEKGFRRSAVLFFALFGFIELLNAAEIQGIVILGVEVTDVAFLLRVSLVVLAATGAEATYMLSRALQSRREAFQIGLSFLDDHLDLPREKRNPEYRDIAPLFPTSVLTAYVDSDFRQGCWNAIVGWTLTLLPWIFAAALARSAYLLFVSFGLRDLGTWLAVLASAGVAAFSISTFRKERHWVGEH